MVYERGIKMLEFMNASSSDALVLNGISKRAFDSDIEVGATTKGGPPGYMSVGFHTKMARSNHLFKLWKTVLSWVAQYYFYMVPNLKWVDYLLIQNIIEKVTVSI